MPITILPVPVTPIAIALKVITVKQLPQSKQVPTIYTTAFHNTEIIDSHLVIKALRTDIATTYALLETVILNLNLQLIELIALEERVVLAELQIALNTAELVDHESRITALENP